MKKNTRMVKSILFALFLFNSPAHALLTENEREATRYRLVNSRNEMSLLIRNDRAFQADLSHQKRDLKLLEVFSRIPNSRDLSGLKKSILSSAKDFPIELKQVHWMGYSPQGDSLPGRIVTGRSFHLKEDQIVEKIFAKIQVSGPKEKIWEWIYSWPETSIRLLELDPKQGLRKMKNGIFEVSFHGFCFRKVQYPELIPTNPIDLLPTRAQKDLMGFKKSEPQLWQIVQNIDSLTPKAKAYYQSRKDYLLNQAKIHFFLSKLARP